MAVIKDIKINSNSHNNNSNSRRRFMEEKNAQRTTWAKSKVIVQSSFTIPLVVAVISISLVEMIIAVFSQLTANYLPNSVDQTLTMDNLRVDLIKLITITNKDMVDSSNSKKINTHNNKITTAENLKTISMIITRAITISRCSSSSSISSSNINSNREVLMQ